jgi:Spy/CpxP family protein refolding chaperone
MNDTPSQDTPAALPASLPPSSPSLSSPPQSSADAKRPNRWRRFMLAGAALTATASALAWHGHAEAHPFGRAHGPGGWQSMDPASIGRKLDAMVAWVLSDIDASPDQRERIGAIFKGAANDMLPLRQSHQKAREESLQLFSAPTVDRARLETLRVQQMQLGDTASRRLLQSMTDAAEVLNADQRAKLVAKWSERRRWRG